MLPTYAVLAQFSPNYCCPGVQEPDWDLSACDASSRLPHIRAHSVKYKKLMHVAQNAMRSCSPCDMHRVRSEPVHKLSCLNDR